MTTPDGSSLRGHVALVTGSNRNIGRAIVLELAERECDVVVNNAALRPEAPFLELTATQWHEVMDVDLHAAFYTAKAFLPGMAAAAAGAAS